MIFPEDVCYGANYTFRLHFNPFHPTNYSLTFTPKNGDPKIVVKDGQSLDSRFKVSRFQVEMINLSERDNEATLSTDSNFRMSFLSKVKLRVKNCRSVKKKLCTDVIYWTIPPDAQYLEFSGPDVDAPPTILWNRTTRSAVRGRASGSLFEIKDLTQRDSGYYRFRGPKDQLQTFDQIVVNVNTRSYDFDEGKVELDYPRIFTPAKVTFLPEGTSRARPVTESSRLRITDRYLIFDYATPEDSGTYDFFDKDDNLILRATVEIREVEKVWVSVAVLSAITFGFILCCCCVKKFCCSDSSDKTSSPESEAEAPSPSVYNHGTQTPEPETPLLPREPRVILPDLPTYNEAGGYIDPPPPYEECVPQPSAPPVPMFPSEDPVPTEPPVNSSEPTNIDSVVNEASVADANQPEQDSATGAATFSMNSFALNTDSDPQFELRGTALPSAPLLSAEGPILTEYEPDKLNFL